MTTPLHVTIRASAGTGKTFQLSSRFLRLLLEGTPEHEILATTFTRKAAGEILSRVLTRLATACQDEAAAAQLAGQLSIDTLRVQQCRQTLRNLVQNLHRIRVGTLDSFFAQLAGSYSLELGLPPGWQILEDQNDRQLRDEAIEALLREGESKDLNQLVHLLTKGEATRGVAELIRDQVKNLYTLYQDAPEAAWHNLPRPKPLAKDKLQDTIDELGSITLPTDNRWATAIAKDLALVADENWESLLSTGVASKIIEGTGKYYNKEIPGDVREVYNKLIQHGTAILLRTLADQTAATHDLLKRFAEQYEPRKFQQQGLLFDDVTRQLAAYLDRSADDEVDRMTYRLDSRVKHLLLDEFQDTSIAQWRVLYPFARRITKRPEPTDTPASGSPSSFLCVGDVKQAIYNWRGGVAEIFDAIERELPDLDQQYLDKSRRSYPAVIRTVNNIFLGLNRHGKLDRLAEPIGHWQKGFREHDTVRSAQEGYAELSTAPRAEDGESQQEANIRHAADVIAEITTKAPDCSIGVLARRNVVVAQLIYEIRQRGIEASEEGGNPLTDSAAVRAVVSLLQMADHPGDTAARMHLAGTPLGPLVDWTNYADDVAAAGLARSVRKTIQSEGYGPTIEGWVRPLLPLCTARDQNRLMQLIEMAYSYSSEQLLRTDQLIWFIKNTRVPDPTAANVRVMTVHQAKGLEFDVVVLPELDTKLTGQSDAYVTGRQTPTSPIARVSMYRSATVQALLPPEIQKMFADKTQQTINESLCNMYVSVTRPVHALYMLISPSAKNERSLHKPHAGLLRAALTDGQPAPPETILYHDGNASWHEALDPPEDSAAATKAPHPAAREIRLAPMPHRKRGLPRMNPSRLSHGAAVDAGTLFQQREQSALTRGTILHACFEQVEWLNDAAPTRQALHAALASVDTVGFEVDDLILEFHEMLKRGDTPKVLSRSFYDTSEASGNERFLPKELSFSDLRLEVFSERPFAVGHDDGILNGTIDRLVLIYASEQLIAADVIDFKSDRVDTSDAEAIAKTVQNYQPQLDAYRAAIHAIYRLPKENIAARLLLVGDGLLCDV